MILSSCHTEGEVMQMRKVVLTMKEQEKYDVIKSVVDHGAGKHRAALTLDLTLRTINRLIAGYKKFGKEFFSHKNKGRKPVFAMSSKDSKRIIDLYNKKYYDASYQFFTELLAKEESIYVSVSTVRNILMGEYILSPIAKKATIRRVKKELEEKISEPISKRKKAVIERKLLDIEDAHPRKPRCANFGEELQMDASQHIWFGNSFSHLHAAIDDATGALTGAYFDAQETLKGYYNVFSQTLKRHGIPYKFRTDKRTVFEYKRACTTQVEEDVYTQFSYACKQLGVHIDTTSIPQGKARIERFFGTMQRRLPILLRLAGATTIEAANEFLNSYIDEFNTQFALDQNGIPSVFEKQPSDEKINLTLAVLTERTVDEGHSLKFYGKYYRPLINDGSPVFFTKGTRGLLIKALDGNLFFSTNDTVAALEEIPLRETFSKEFSPKAAPATKEKKPRYSPPPTHPWRLNSFKKFCAGMPHRPDMPSAGLRG